MTTTTVLPPPTPRPDPYARPRHQRPGNLAARIAGWSARHRTTAIVGWLLFVVVATALSAVLGTVQAADSSYGHGESGRATELIAAGGFPDRAGEMVLIHSDDQLADSPTFTEAVTATVSAVEGTGRVENVSADTISADRHSALVTFDLSGPADTAVDRVDAVRDAVAGVQRQFPDLLVAQTGDASLDQSINEILAGDMHRLSLLSIPVTLGILIVAFGALLAAVLPMGLALTAFLASSACSPPPAGWCPRSTPLCT